MLARKFYNHRVVTQIVEATHLVMHLKHRTTITITVLRIKGPRVLLVASRFIPLHMLSCTVSWHSSIVLYLLSSCINRSYVVPRIDDNTRIWTLFSVAYFMLASYWCGCRVYMDLQPGAINYCRPILASLWHALHDVKRSVKVTDNNTLFWMPDSRRFHPPRLLGSHVPEHDVDHFTPLTIVLYHSPMPTRGYKPKHFAPSIVGAGLPLWKGGIVSVLGILTPSPSFITIESTRRDSCWPPVSPSCDGVTFSYWSSILGPEAWVTYCKYRWWG